MSYQLKYQAEFDSITSVGYRLEIHQKNYTGLFYTLELAAAPVIHKWNTDNPKAPVKGSSLTIRYLNTGNTPIETFFSLNDDEFLVKFYSGAQLLFTGFLVQDDFNEVMVDYTHEVVLSANDNIGLLKDIELDVSGIVNTLPCIAEGDYISITAPPQNWIYLTNINFVPTVGVPFTIASHPVSAMNGTFTPTAVVKVSDTKYNVRTATFTGDAAAAPCFINGNQNIPSNNPNITLLQIIQACLSKTGLELNTYIYANLYEYSIDLLTVFLNQIYINPDTFSSGDKMENCYSVLEKIMSRFNLNLFQSLGRWNIVRWDEIRLANAIPGVIYDKDFVFQGTTTLPTFFLTGFQQLTEPETGLSKTIVRPYKFVKETFNYEQPKYLLNNYDFKKLGVLIRTYISGTDTYKEYQPIGFENGDVPPHGELLIRVVTNNLGIEVERYLVVKTPQGNAERAARSLPVLIAQGDKAVFTGLVRFNFLTSIQSVVYMDFKITDGTQVRHLYNNPTTGKNEWHPTLLWRQILIVGNPLTTWDEITADMPPFPFAGILTIHYALPNSSPGFPYIGTFYKDLRLEYTPYFNGSTKLLGHTHKTDQPAIIKNNQDTEIFIDDSPRNNIKGTLLTSFFDGYTQIKTREWTRTLGTSDSGTLGKIITSENLQYNGVSRIKLEGSFRGLFQTGVCVNMQTWIKYNELPGVNFLFGSLEIDYRNDKLSAVLWEFFKDSEGDSVYDYFFTYLYDTK